VSAKLLSTKCFVEVWLKILIILELDIIELICAYLKIDSL